MSVLPFTLALVALNVLKTASRCFTVSLPSSIHEKGPAGAVQGVYSSMPIGIINKVIINTVYLPHPQELIQVIPILSTYLKQPTMINKLLYSIRPHYPLHAERVITISYGMANSDYKWRDRVSKLTVVGPCHLK